MATSPTENSHLHPLDNSHRAMVAVVTTAVRSELADFTRNLLPALRDVFAEQLTAQKRVLDAVNAVCDEQAARLEYFVKLSKRARDTLEKLTAEVQEDETVDESEDALPSIDSILGGLMGGESKGKLPDKLQKIIDSLNDE